MLKLTKKADYGLIALRHLAVARAGRMSTVQRFGQRYRRRLRDSAAAAFKSFAKAGARRTADF